jgi:hypothetical protein
MLTFFRVHCRFAIVGFIITAAFIVFQLATDPLSDARWENALMLAFMILCPPSFMSIPVIDAEVGTSSFYFLWTVIALLNAALYAALGGAIARLRGKST